jgi:hypothetical protein
MIERERGEGQRITKKRAKFMGGGTKMHRDFSFLELHLSFYRAFAINLIKKRERERERERERLACILSLNCI